MTCDADSMRRSAAAHRSRAAATSPASAATRASASRAKTSTGASSSRRACSRRARSRCSAPETWSEASSAASRHSPSAACSPPPAGAVPRGRGLERRPRRREVSERPQDAPEVNAGERRQPHITDRFGLLDRDLERAGANRVVTGLALRTSEAEALIGLGLQEAETSRRFRCLTEVHDGVVEATLDPGQLAQDRVAADVKPRVVERSQPMLDLVAGLDGAHVVTGGDRGPGGEEPVRGLIPRSVEPVVERARCDRSAPAPDRTRRHATRRRRGSSSSAPAGRRHRSCPPVRWLRRCARERGRGARSRLRSMPRATARRPGLGPARRRRRHRVLAGAVGRLWRRRGRSRPSRTR